MDGIGVRVKGRGTTKVRQKTGLPVVGQHELQAVDRESSVTIIQPSKGWVALRTKDLWSYRELLYFFVWRDIKVRYKQTLLGAAWAIIQPLFTMVVFSLFFGRLAKVPSDGIPYPVFSFAALVPWAFFATGVTQASSSLVNNQNLIKKVYFNRLTLPLSSVLSGVVDFCLAFIVLLIMMLAYGMPPGLRAFSVFGFLILALISSLGAGLWLAALNVRYRDVRYVVPFLIQFWLFATPIAYPASLLSGVWRTLYGLNPMVGVVEGFRWALLGTKISLGPTLLVSIGAMLCILVGGAYYFRRVERTFADIV